MQTTHTDLRELNLIRLKIASGGTWPPTRDDIREVGKIREKHGLARQRDDETYEVFLGRLIRNLETGEA